MHGMDGPDKVYGEAEGTVVGALEERSMRGGHVKLWNIYFRHQHLYGAAQDRIVFGAHGKVVGLQL